MTSEYITKAISGNDVSNGGVVVAKPGALSFASIAGDAQALAEALNNRLVWVPNDLRDFDAAVSHGRLPGYFTVNKFGGNPSSAADAREDIWDGGGTYSFPTTATITHISQATNQAALNGETVEVQGLDANWDLVVQNVTLDADDTTTAVALTTPLLRVFRMKVMATTVGSSNINLKNVGGSTTYATITAGKNQTLMAIYTVPRNYTCYMRSYYASVVNATNKTPTATDIELWAQNIPGGYTFQLKHSIGLPKESAPLNYLFNPWYVFSEKTDIKLSALCSDQDGETHGGFDLILVRKT